ALAEAAAVDHGDVAPVGVRVVYEAEDPARVLTVSRRIGDEHRLRWVGAFAEAACLHFACLTIETGEPVEHLSRVLAMAGEPREPVRLRGGPRRHPGEFTGDIPDLLAAKRLRAQIEDAPV